jgi:hypothetical protein
MSFLFGWSSSSSLPNTDRAGLHAGNAAEDQLKMRHKNLQV